MQASLLPVLLLGLAPSQTLAQPPVAQLPGAQLPVHAVKPFRITVVDEQTGRGVPLVELRTVHAVSLITDSNGIAAFHEPGLMDQDVYFHVSSHGYEYPADGFGNRGKALRITAGGQARLEIRRLNLAQRLYRITGAGIYRDSLLVGAPVPLREPVLSGQVLGSDSVVNAVYRGQMYWFWGDTLRPAYPLGNYHVPGATSQLPGQGGLEPGAGIDLNYFLDARGFAKETAHMPGRGPTWLTALTTLPDDQGRERLYAAYVKVDPPLKVHARGLAVFQDEAREFKSVAAVALQAPAFPMGHALRHREDEVEHVFFAHPFPVTRVRATARQFLRPEEYETYTCLKEGSRLEEPQLERTSAGQLRYGWRKNTPALDPSREAQLLKAGTLQPHESRWQLRARDTGKRITPHAGSVSWNAYRRRWILIAVQTGGTSFLGEVWYAEADTPVGPWAYAVKVATHERYSFYNPKQQPVFDRDGGRVIFFEGTYTHTFSGNPRPTPRYEYNQVMYQLDLAEPRLALPVAVYDQSGGKGTRFATSAMQRPTTPDAAPAAFFALDRPAPKTLAVVAGKEGLQVDRGQAPRAEALFHALPADSPVDPETTTPLYEYRHRDEMPRVYSLQAALTLPGYERQPQPLCRVWKK